MWFAKEGGDADAREGGHRRERRREQVAGGGVCRGGNTSSRKEEVAWEGAKLRERERERCRGGRRTLSGEGELRERESNRGFLGEKGESFTDTYGTAAKHMGHELLGVGPCAGCRDACGPQGHALGSSVGHGRRDLTWLDAAIRTQNCDLPLFVHT